MEPRYRNTCPTCTFFGFINGWDIYTCDRGDLFPTLVARDGNKPCDYLSGDRLTLDGITIQFNAGWVL